MTEISWARMPQNQVLEVQFTVRISRLVRARYWLARKLILLAAWIINSQVTYNETLPVLELE